MRTFDQYGMTWHSITSQDDIDAVPEGANLAVESGVAIGDIEIRRKVSFINVYGTVAGSICVYGTGKVGIINVSGKVEGGLFVSGTVAGSINVSGTVAGSITVYSTVAGSIDVSGTVDGDIDVYGAVEGSINVFGAVAVSITVSGTVNGSIYVSGTGKVGRIYVSNTGKVGLINVYGTVEGNITVSGTVVVGVNVSGECIAGAFSDMREAFRAAKDELPVLIAALKEGRVNGSVYVGECCCLVGMVEKACAASGKKSPLQRNPESPSERWFLGIPRGHTPENNGFAREALRIAEEVLAEAK